MVSEDLIEFLKGWESLKLKSSLDPVASQLGRKVYDVGYGHVIHESEHPMSITRDIADHILRSDVESVEERMKPLVTVPLMPHEWDALVSFAFNVGVGSVENDSGFAGSTLLELLNSGDYDGAANQFARWNKSGGRIKLGLIKRRAAEKAIFQLADYGDRP